MKIGHISMGATRIFQKGKHSEYILTNLCLNCLRAILHMARDDSGENISLTLIFSINTLYISLLLKDRMKSSSLMNKRAIRMECRNIMIMHLFYHTRSGMQIYNSNCNAIQTFL
jgi:hypothetical protein